MRQMSVPSSGRLGNILGAFADGAVLFPILAALSRQSGFSGATLLATAGLAYLAAAWLFRVPMSVQPLKAIAIAALATGATTGDIRVAAALLGVFCLLLSAPSIDTLARRIPIGCVHAVQLGLGILLLRQGLKYGLAGSNAEQLWAAGLAVALVLATALSSFPWFGLTATLGISWAAVSAWQSGAGSPGVLDFAPSTLVAPLGPWQGSTVLALVLPQIALTFFNSVVATRDVSQRYFGERAERVTVSRLLRSIGWGNLLAATVSGLPFCHGSGGLTAHYRGGARHWSSNVLIGGALMAFAAIQYRQGGAALAYPVPLLAASVLTVGLFHAGLARPSWDARGGKVPLLAAAVVAATTQNMLWVLGVGVTFELLGRIAGRNLERTASV